ncbi:MAG: hypothetical protein V1725_05615 [archaeon]
MSKTITQKVLSGMDAFSKRIASKKRIYTKLLALAEKDKSPDKTVMITDKKLFDEVMRHFGAVLENAKAKYDLQSIYEIGIHKETGALIISNKGATLFSLSPRTNTPYMTRHIGCCVYFPGLGVEYVNVGLVGDVYDGKVIFRSESACSPSFLFGSQRCNCAYQWDSMRELAAHFNTIRPPQSTTGSEFEAWVQNQVMYSRGKHTFKQKGKIGFVLMHLDTQNGMGSGYSQDEFSFDLYTRAAMRHRGEYSSEQIHKTTMLGGFKAIGLRPDPRREDDNAGYKLAFVILDYLHISRDIVFLTNNPLKMQHLENNGYALTRVKSLGAVTLAGSQEAEQRSTEFDHLDINGNCVTFEEDIRRLQAEINAVIKRER